MKMIKNKRYKRTKYKARTIKKILTNIENIFYKNLELEIFQIRFLKDSK